MPIFSCPCPICKEITPHQSVGSARDEKGRKMQPMRCVKCKTLTEVATGEHGEEFQDNIDMPIDSEADDAGGEEKSN